MGQVGAMLVLTYVSLKSLIIKLPLHEQFFNENFYDKSPYLCNGEQVYYDK